MRPYPIARYIIPPIIGLWIKNITGLENLPKSEAFIIATNHSSYIEHLMIGSSVVPYLNKKIHTLAKKEHFNHFFEGLWHKYLAAIPIDRSKGKGAMKIAIDYLKKGKIILIYPEGTRSLTGKIQKGKTGIAKLALWAKVPIVPLGIIGTFEILPKGKKIPKMKRATLNFGKPTYFNKYYKKPITKKLLRNITDTIMKEIAKLSNQKYNF
ncbi:1-acyl-sn-glycerol-3-phosphate acyltransferase [Candidatus Woesearchaeota archaeon]|nr:1-acyl-sn-glycerol-3-phosphate acyltransferase [Candidatus Woesearchaeota archaeon]|tara:strand:+ start:2409 stop:3038 length:630 start_codon:yes stop_codon:yes gene_type:complete